MNLHSILADERAVSPVIGVILMVAITVILAAVVGSFVLGIGGDVQPSSPNANFQFSYAANGADYDVTATHSGGDTIPASESLELVTTSGTATFSGSVSAGSAETVTAVPAGSTVRIVWMTENGEDSAVLADDEVPA